MSLPQPPRTVAKCSVIWSPFHGRQPTLEIGWGCDAYPKSVLRYGFHIMRFCKRHHVVQQRKFPLEHWGRSASGPLCGSGRAWNPVRVLSGASCWSTGHHTFSARARICPFTFNLEKASTQPTNSYFPSISFLFVFFTFFFFNFPKPVPIASLRELRFQYILKLGQVAFSFIYPTQ